MLVVCPIKPGQVGGGNCAENPEVCNLLASEGAVGAVGRVTPEQILMNELHERRGRRVADEIFGCSRSLVALVIISLAFVSRTDERMRR
jgi:hypothetical protein